MDFTPPLPPPVPAPAPYVDAQARPLLFGLHLHPGVDVVGIQVILLHLAAGPHLHAVCEVTAAWGQDEVVDEHSQGSPMNGPTQKIQWLLKLCVITAEPKDRAGLIPQPV